MKLKELLKGINYKDSKGNLDVEIDYLSQNTNKTASNTLFFCYKGVSFDGHDYLLNNTNTNIVAIVVERYIDCDLPQILVSKTRNVMHKFCYNFFGKQLKKLKLIGVTGTNGKTTTAGILYQILQKDNRNVGLIGTNGIYYKDKYLSQNLTTPDTIDFFYIINDMQKLDVKYVIMEVSAHAIDLNKLYGVKFEIGVFTNLSPEHLDYFKTMGKYALCKLKFLKKRYCKNVVINSDDSYGKLFLQVSDSNVFTYGIDNVSQNFAMDLNLNLSFSSFLVNVFDNVFDIKTNLICKYNVYNELATIVCSKLLNVDNDSIVKTLQCVQPISGRLNMYKLNNGAYVIIDFAHTPDALEKTLENLRKLCPRRLITVFGCGGNRDRLKRSKMGNIATLLSDYVFVTSDNPRFEDPLKIINDIVDGIKIDNYEIDENRTRAIIKAINYSKENDLIIIAGKGNEDYQEYLNNKYDYSDKDVIKQYLIKK